MRIRIATHLDRHDIGNVHLCAFTEGEREIVSTLAIKLLSEKSTPQTISLVAETKGSVVGHVAFSPVTIDNDKNLQGYILAPLGVKPDHQNHCIGSNLVECGKQLLLIKGVHVLFVYGDPEYYGRFGFSADTANRYIPPYKLQYPSGWQAIELNKCNNEKPSITIACVTSLCDPEIW